MVRTTFSAMLAAVAAGVLIASAPAFAQQSGSKDFTPTVGQPGKDVVWVPTPDEVVERMLRMAQVTSRDVVYDLGSGDGRTVIAAQKKFGARAKGIEFNPEMVELSRKNAAREGAKVEFVRGDVFVEDFSEATVITLYLLPSLNIKLRPKLLDMKPGTRISSHQFTMEDWEPDEVSDFDWRRAYHWIVPAKVQGAWMLEVAGSRYEVELTQKFQKIEGTVRMDKLKAGLREPKLRGDKIWFAFIDQQGVKRDFEGTVAGGRIEGAFRPDSGAEGRFSASKK